MRLPGVRPRVAQSVPPATRTRPVGAGALAASGAAAMACSEKELVT